MKKQNQRVFISSTLPEIFERTRKFETFDEKVQFLIRHRSKALAFVVNAMYNEDWSKTKVPKYTRSKYDLGNCPSSIAGSLSRLINAQRLSFTNPYRSNQLLAIVMETVHRDEALLIEGIIEGRKIDGISKSVFRKVYPEFFRSTQEG